MSMVSVRDTLTSVALDRREAEQLLMHVLGRNRAWLYAHAGDAVEEQQATHFVALAQRRAGGEPLAYITGTREFWSLPLRVSPAVLIPREDSETLVAWALALAGEGALKSLLDLGTGSGALALALASELPGVRVTATDRSASALAVARHNGSALGLTVEWLEGSWFAPLGGRRWPLIVSNPPYIATDDYHLNEGDLPAEPRAALVSGPSGLECLSDIVEAAPDHLEDDGWLLLEHGWTQGADVRRSLEQAGFVEVSTRHDLAGRDRVSGGRYRRG